MASERPLEREPVPRAVEFGGHGMVIWNMLRDVRQTEKVETTGLYMILGDDFLITARLEEIAEIASMFRRLGEEVPPRREHPAFFLYAVLNATVEEWFPMVEGLPPPSMPASTALTSGTSRRSRGTVATSSSG